MSVTKLFFSSIVTSISAACFVINTACAEVGKGIAEDPVTREYARGVPRDWQEGIALHSETGNYIITYKNDAGSFSQIIFEPATKISPTIISKFKAVTSKDVIIYRYNLHNAPVSKQGISLFKTLVSNANLGSSVSASNWQGAVVPTLTDSNLFLSWTCRSGEERCSLPPGKSQRGFTIESKDLPGIRIAEVVGNAKTTTWLGQYEPSTSVGKQIEDLTSARDFVPVPIAVPRIPNANPYDGAGVLDALRTHISKDIVELKLIEPVFASQLDRSLQSAADAIRRNSIKAAREHLHDAMKLLKKDHPDCDKEDDGKDDDDDKNTRGNTGSVDRLAARVIAFDIRYVEKRLRDK